MRKKDPKHFWWKSFFLAFLSQQPMLIGLSLPQYAIHFGANAEADFGFLDLILCGLCLLGISIGYLSDRELRNFMLMNKERVQQRKSKILILYKGLWRYSRHPNYFGEAFWWTSLAGFSQIVGETWTVIGTIFNTQILYISLKMIEERMVRYKDRRTAYENYQRFTSVMIPMPGFGNLSQEFWDDAKTGFPEKQAYGMSTWGDYSHVK